MCCEDGVRGVCCEDEGGCCKDGVRCGRGTDVLGLRLVRMCPHAALARTRNESEPVHPRNTVVDLLLVSLRIIIIIINFDNLLLVLVD